MLWTNRGKFLLLAWVFRGEPLPDNFYVMLATVDNVPTEDTNIFDELTEIADGKGYTEGGYELTPGTTDFDVVTEDDTRDRALVQIKDLTWTADEGTIPDSGNGIRYAVLTDDSESSALATGERQVIAVWDMETDRVVTNGNVLSLTDLELRMVGLGGATGTDSITEGEDAAPPLWLSPNLGWVGVDLKNPGVVLCSGTTDGDTLPLDNAPPPFDDREITFDVPVALTSGTKYAIVPIPVTAVISWASDNVGAYADGELYTDSGGDGTWTISTILDFYFITKESGVVKDSNTFVGDSSYFYSAPTLVRAQTFMASSAYDISSVVVRLAKNSGFGDPGIVTVSIREMTGGVSWFAEDEINPIIFTVNGSDYEITSGTSYGKYIYWSPASPTSFLGTNDLEVATATGCYLVCTNNDGVPSPEY
ncbi:MAG TPA: hypothetical protein VMW53_00720 [archaeon]|nr:hypothetical protein [archaeon]